MNIHEIPKKIKSDRVFDAVILLAIIFSMAVISFYLGRLSVLPDRQTESQVKIIVPNSELIKNNLML